MNISKGVMFFHVLNIILVLCLHQTYGLSINGTANPFIVKIVGGHEVSISDFPYQVSFRINDQHICGGSLIARHYVLTAGHCVKYHDNVNSMGVVMGHSRLRERHEVYRVTNVLVHPNYTEDDYKISNDIAILQLSKPAKINNVTIALIPLAEELPRVGKYCTVSGWGSTKEPHFGEAGRSVDQLRAVSVPITNYKTCKLLAQVEGVVCAGEYQGGKDSCQGDSGGPLACDGVLTGIVSWGAGCGRKAFPGVYTDVSYFTDWIRNNSLASTGPIFFRSLFVPIVLLQLVPFV